MTKGYLCILAACGIALPSAVAFAQSPPDDRNSQAVEARISASSGVEAAAEAALAAASVSPAEVRYGWSIRRRFAEEQPSIVAVRSGWSLVADDANGDRLAKPRLIGSDYVAWGSTANLTNDGVTIQNAVVLTRNQWVSAEKATVAFQPFEITLEGIEGQADHVE